MRHINKTAPFGAADFFCIKNLVDVVGIESGYAA